MWFSAESLYQMVRQNNTWLKTFSHSRFQMRWEKECCIILYIRASRGRGEWFPYTWIRTKSAVNLNRYCPVLEARLLCQLKSLRSGAWRCGCMRIYVNVRMRKCVCATVRASVNLWIIYSRPTRCHEESTLHHPLSVWVITFMCSNTKWVFSITHFFSAMSLLQVDPVTSALWQKWERSPFPPVNQSQRLPRSCSLTENVNHLCWYSCERVKINY